MKRILGLTVGLMIVAAPVFAQDVPFHGFVQTNYSARVAHVGDVPEGMAAKEKDLILGDTRAQLELAGFSHTGNAAFSAKLDFYRDAIDGGSELDLREAYLDLSLWKFDFRVGRQIITWGLGDLVFINDVFPKDWVAFLSGRPLEYLKVGSDALSLSFHPGFLSAQGVILPFFEPDAFPTGERLFYFNPILPYAKRMETHKPELQFKHFEAAGRIYRTLGRLDLSLYGYRGFHRRPGMRFDPQSGDLILFYPELGVYGASAQGTLLSGVFSLEGGYSDSVEDRDGIDPSIENPQIKLLAGYSRMFGADLTVGVQYLGEVMLKYDAYEASLGPMQALLPHFPKQEQVRHNLTFRAVRFLKYQTLRFSLFTWASPNDEDYYLNPEVRYSFTDELWVALGGNIFGGTEDHTFFGQFDPNDNVYVTLRYGF